MMMPRASRRPSAIIVQVLSFNFHTPAVRVVTMREPSGAVAMPIGSKVCGRPCGSFGAGMF